MDTDSNTAHVATVQQIRQLHYLLEASFAFEMLNKGTRERRRLHLATMADR